jgi:hypothetical protein
MLRRGAGDCYSRYRAICRDLRHIVQFARTPTKTLRSRGCSAEYFPQFHGGRHTRELAACHSVAAEKSGCGRMRSRWLVMRSRWLVMMPPFGRQFAATIPQDAHVGGHDMCMTCKCLSMLKTRSKTLVSRRSFAVACPHSAASGSSQIARSPRMHLKRFDDKAFLSPALPGPLRQNSGFRNSAGSDRCAASCVSTGRT